jgi:hypothetical protein
MAAATAARLLRPEARPFHGSNIRELETVEAPGLCGAIQISPRGPGKATQAFVLSEDTLACTLVRTRRV